MSNTLSELKPATDGRRRRFTPEQKPALLREAARPGSSLSKTAARQDGVAVSLLSQWKRLMDDATESSLTRDEKNWCPRATSRRPNLAFASWSAPSAGRR